MILNNMNRLTELLGFFFSSRRRHTRYIGDWSSDVCSSDLQRTQGWKVGVDGSVAIIAVGAGGAIDTNSIRSPIVGFIFDQKGLMYNLTLEGSKRSEARRVGKECRCVWGG